MTTQLSVPENALSMKEVPSFTALCFTTRATLLTLSQHAFGVAENLYQEAARLGLNGTGPIQWIYTGVYGNETNEFQLEIALPIRQPGAEPHEFSYREFPKLHCVTHTYTGPWSDFLQVYDALFVQLHRDGYQNDGRVREIYQIIDTENLEKCVTEIQIAVV